MRDHEYAYNNEKSISGRSEKGKKTSIRRRNQNKHTIEPKVSRKTKLEGRGIIKDSGLRVAKPVHQKGVVQQSNHPGKFWNGHISERMTEAVPMNQPLRRS